MKRTLILAPSEVDLSDPLLHTLATVLGPARIVTPDDITRFPDDADRLIVFTRPESDQRRLAQLIRQNQKVLEAVPARRASSAACSRPAAWRRCISRAVRPRRKPDWQSLSLP